MQLGRVVWGSRSFDNEIHHTLKIGDITIGAARANYDPNPEAKPYVFQYKIDLGFNDNEKIIYGWGLSDLAKQADTTIREFIGKLL